MVASIAVCILAGCSPRQAPTPTTLPAPTVAVPATRQAPSQRPSPTPAVQATPTPTETDYAPTRPFTLTLAADWTTISAAEDTTNNSAPAGAQAPTSQAHVAPLAAHRQAGTGATLAQLLVVELPREDLTPETYLAGAAEALAAQGATVSNHMLRDDLRPDHTPVALLDYQTNADTPSAADTLPHGRQAALFTPDGAVVILISYAYAPGVDPSEFDHIVETMVVGKLP